MQKDDMNSAGVVAPTGADYERDIADYGRGVLDVTQEGLHVPQEVYPRGMYVTQELYPRGMHVTQEVCTQEV